jgi:GNAT superfamily N-acetyltransferase
VNSHTPFADLPLSQRLESAEGRGGVAFVEARKTIDPAHEGAWMERRGAVATFDGPASPVTQTFGLGLSGPIGADDLDALEAFFFERGADVCHEVSPLAGVELFAALASRGYTPVELTSVMFQPLSDAERPVQPSEAGRSQVCVRQISVHEADMFGRISAEGWSERPDVRPFLEGFGRAIASRRDGPCFVAEIDGAPIAAGVLMIWNGVALLAGAATIPQYRRRGAQLALLDARLQFARLRGCDIAMMCAAPGSASQRNAERHGFRIAYTRVKWQRKL